MRGTLPTKLVLALLIAALVFSPLVFEDLAWVKMAYADDDDDGDDDEDDDDDDDDQSSSPGSSSGVDRSTPSPQTSRPNTIRRTTTRASTLAPAPLAQFAPDEIVALGLSEGTVASLEALGFTVLGVLELPFLNAISRRFSIPEGIKLEDARDQMRALQTDAVIDFNHFYRLQSDEVACEGPHCEQFGLVGLDMSDETRATCSVDIKIGVIDTGINPDHETFVDSQLEVISQVPEGRKSSSTQHGTAVAALLVGSPKSRSPGLLSGAEVVAIDAFYAVGNDERSDIFSILKAMNTLADKGVDVINMSFAGPASTLMERAVFALYESDVVVVAATGNNGHQAPPVFPAAYDQAIGVTAIDRYAEVYRRAGRGPHVDFAAPGVDVWTAASVRGARSKTGTSFAAPFVAAAAALVVAKNPNITPDAVRQKLMTTAKDLGVDGHDEVFGHGLIQLAGFCAD